MARLQALQINAADILTGNKLFLMSLISERGFNEISNQNSRKFQSSELICGVSFRKTPCQ